MTPRTTLACACLAALAACAAPSSSDAPPMRSATAPVAIRGNATYVERIKMPPGASLRVELLDAASGQPVAQTRLDNVAGPPIAFAIAPPAGSASGGYALRATLFGPQGERWFETPAPVAAPVGGNDVELRMRGVAAPGTATPATASTTHWECGELGVMSRFDAGSGSVELSFNGRRVTLPLARSASGARYADDAGNEFWTKGATGHLTLAGEPARDCVQAAQASPWNAARARGVAARAVGSEPGWSAEVSGGPPTLDALLDYGEQRLQLPLTPVDGGFDGVTGAGRVHLRMQRKECRDGMSGQAFEATVTLEAEGRTWRGCGAWLQD